MAEIQNIFWPIAGVDEGEANPQLTQGSLRLQDVSYTQAGAVSKRYGLATGGSDTNNIQLATFDGGLVSYGSTGEVSRDFTYKGTTVASGVEWTDSQAEPLPIDLFAGLDYYEFDEASIGNYKVYAAGFTNVSTNKTTLMLWVNDSTGQAVTRTTLLTDTSTTNKAHVRLIENAYLNNVCVLYTSGAGLWYRRTVSVEGDVSVQGALTGVSTVVAGTAGGHEWDACQLGASGEIGAIFTTGTTIKLASVATANGTEITIASGVTSPGPVGICPWVYTGQAAIMWVDQADGDVYCGGISLDGTVYATAEVVYTGTPGSVYVVNMAPVALDNTTVTCWMSLVNRTATTNEYIVYKSAFSYYSGAGAPATAMRNAWMVSKPFIRAGGEAAGYSYCWLAVGPQATDLAKTALLCRSDSKISAKAMPDSLYSYAEFDTPTYHSQLLRPVQTVGSASPYSYTVTLPEFRTTTLRFGRLVTVDWSYQSNAYEFEGGLIFSGGLPRIFDGATLTELGFSAAPEMVVTPTAGSGMTAGEYSYIAVYEWLDALGHLHRSAPSIAATGTADATNGTMTVNVLGITATDKRAVSITIYRTAVDGSVHYHLTSLWGAGWSSFVDNTPSSDVESNAMLYSDQGILSYIQPPPFDVGTISNGRMFLSPRANPTYVYYSNIFEKGEGLSFTGVGEIPVSGLELPTAIQQIGTTVVVFTDNNIYAYPGEGLSKVGSIISGNLWGENFTHLSKGLGLYDAKSVLNTTKGVVFLAKSGMKLLGINMEIQHIGKNMAYVVREDDLAGAFVRSDIDAWIWIGGSTGYVYFHKYGQWAEWTGYYGSSATQIGQTIYLLNSTKIWKESTEVITDRVSNTITATVTTPWFSFGQVNGYQRLKYMYLLGMLPLNNVSVTVESGYDFSPCWQFTDTATTGLTVFDYGKYYDSLEPCACNLADLWVPPSSGEDGEIPGYYQDCPYTDYRWQPFQIKWIPHKQACTSVRFQLTIPSGEVIITGLTFGVAGKKGGHRIGSTRRM